MTFFLIFIAVVNAAPNTSRIEWKDKDMNPPYLADNENVINAALGKQAHTIKNVSLLPSDRQFQPEFRCKEMPRLCTFDLFYFTSGKFNVSFLGMGENSSPSGEALR